MHGFLEMLRRFQRRSAKPDAPGFRRFDPFRLPLADVGSLVFRNEGEYLQHDIAQEGSHQVFPPPGAQKRHIQDYDIDPFLFRKDPPLVLDLLVVASQTVYALDIEQVVFF